MGKEFESNTEDNEVVKVSPWVKDVSRYIHCGQMIGVRGFSMPTFEIRTDGVMNQADITILGKDAKVVEIIMDYVEERERDLKLTVDQTYDLISKTVDLLSYVRNVTSPRTTSR